MATAKQGRSILAAAVIRSFGTVPDEEKVNIYQPELGYCLPLRCRPMYLLMITKLGAVDPGLWNFCGLGSVHT